MNNDKWSTADICDTLGEMANILPLPFKFYGRLRRFCGPVFTVDLPDGPVVVGSLLQREGHGRVLLADARSDCSVALIGDRATEAAIENGWAGIVLIGAVRDVATLRDAAIGIAALGSSPRRAPLDGRSLDTRALCIAGRTIYNDFWVYADEDGIVVTNKQMIRT